MSELEVANVMACIAFVCWVYESEYWLRRWSEVKPLFGFYLIGQGCLSFGFCLLCGWQLLQSYQVKYGAN